MSKRSKSSSSRSRRAQSRIPLFCGATAAYLALCLVLGGGTRAGFFTDVALQALGVPLMLWAAWRLLDVPPENGGRQARAIMLVCVFGAALPIAQLLPLPPALWTALPGRADFAQTLSAAGIEVGWMPLSLVPSGTWLSALALVPPVAVLLSAVQLGYADRRLPVLVLVIAGVGGAILGLVQLAQGPASPLRFYAFTNTTEAVGFFANRNHYAALLYCLVPFAGAWSIAAMAKAGQAGSYRSSRVLPHLIVAMIGIAVVAVLVAAVAMARSRAGLGLMLVALLGTLAMAYAVPSVIADPSPAARRNVVARVISWLMLAAIGLAAAFAAQSALPRLRERFSADLLDGRMPLMRNTLDAAMAYMPFGSGMGTFVQVYPAFEKASDGFIHAYVNRAHNDFLELWLEAGVAGLVAMLLFLVWVAFACIRVWRRGLPGAAHEDRLLACSATLALVLLLVHSSVDYPLRTTALMAVFALVIAMVIAPLRSGVASARSSRPPHGAEDGGPSHGRTSLPLTPVQSPGFIAAAPPRGAWPAAWRTPGRSGSPDAP